jgi:hypothetical protein
MRTIPVVLALGLCGGLYGGTLGGCVRTPPNETPDAATDASDAATDASNPAPDASIDGFPDGCHYDCFGALECRSGMVRYSPPTAVPCAHWTGECPHTDMTCREGCAQGDFSVPFLRLRSFDLRDRLAALCSETPAARPGDACEPLLCRPTRAAALADGSVTQSYLRCGANSQCETDEPPVIERYLEPCTPTAAQYGRPGESGYVSDGYESYCLIHHDAEAGCVRQGRTILCLGDWDCPQGSTCDAGLRRLDLPTALGTPVCRPGPRGPLRPSDLSCP